MRTPRWGLTYLDAAALVSAHRPDQLGEAVVVLERGLAWHARATTELGSEHELALSEVASKLKMERLDLLMRIPERRSEALYAVEAALAERAKDLALLSRMSPWMEKHFPDRALNAYANAQAARPKDAMPRMMAGTLLLSQADAAGAEMRAAGSARRVELQRMRQGKLQDARRQFERAEALGHSERELFTRLARVCRGLGDGAAAEAWAQRARVD